MVSTSNDSGIYESNDFTEGMPLSPRRETGASPTPNKFGKSKKANGLYDSMDSGTVKPRRESVLKHSITNTKENDKACCEKGCLVF